MLETIAKKFHSQIKELEELLFSNLTDVNQELQNIIQYSFLSGGKRIRPIISIILSNGLNIEPKEKMLIATAVESIHCASLLHDDIIDHSELRRGQITANKKWNKTLSVLSGDILFAKSLSLLVKCSCEIAKYATITAKEIIRGECQQFYTSIDFNITSQQYLDIIYAKTAALFELSCQLNGALAKLIPQQQQQLITFGKNIGLAFQIMDDILDYIGNKNRIGKNTCNDFQEGKITLPLIYALKNKKNKKLIKNLFACRKDKDSAAQILTLLKMHNCFEHAFQDAKKFIIDAMKILNNLPILAESKQQLLTISSYVLQQYYDSI